MEEHTLSLEVVIIELKCPAKMIKCPVNVHRLRRAPSE